MMFVMQSSLYAGTAPTQENVTKLYVATFNRAPDAAGLNYWVTGAGLDLEGIAQSFFDQPETQEVYPSGSTTANFVEAVYSNLFNRASDQAGLDYWIGELDSGRLTRSVFIQAAINGAQDTEEFGNDAMILMNKTTVGLAFANAGLNDTTDARDIMLGVTDGEGTVTAALLSYEILETLLAGNTLYVGGGEIALESWTFSADLSSITWRELVGGTDTGSGTASVDGMTITYTEDGEISTIVVTEILADYMLIAVDGRVAQRLYFDEAKARAYFVPDADLNTPAEVEKNIIGTWSVGCVNDDSDGMSGTDKITFKDDGTGSYMGADYDAPGCTGNVVDSWSGSFKYVIGEEVTTGAAGEAAVKIDLLEEGLDLYTMLHFTSVNTFMLASGGEDDGDSTPETRGNDFQPETDWVYTKQ